MLKDKTAYARGDMLEKRARLMAEWARFCSTPQTAGELMALAEGDARSIRTRHL